MISVAPSIDVVIPVYNSPVLTHRCIESVLNCLSKSIGHVYIQDDASDEETRRMLDRLPEGQIHVHHAPRNQGFGASVNEAAARSSATYLLVLNSDTTVSGDFLGPLCAALAADSNLAAVIPGGNEYDRYDLSQYMRQPGGYIRTYRFQAFAFLIRRKIFMEAGGFDPTFGRGYYEDIDLGRRLDLRGWRLGVHPDARIHHAGGASFGRGRAFRDLVTRNRKLYFARYPNARRNILLLSGQHSLTQFSSGLDCALESVFRGGGYVHWFMLGPPKPLPCLQMRRVFTDMRTTASFMVRWRADKRISEVWMLRKAPRLWRALFLLWARVNGLTVVFWEETGSPRAR